MKPVQGTDVLSSVEFSPNGQKKFCGYLRKKRNKVGGWSKLWFVLQDRLLVSYKSREDYYNKLVSFKDILNLMPGTQIRPLEGFNFRFIIETTTQTITFHCDDRDAYREWISKLLDCLATSSAPVPTARLCPHFSVDDLTYAHAHITTRNFDSIIGAERNVLSRKSNVEKILERNVDCLYEHSVKRQAVKQHIERMNITAESEYRRGNYSDSKDQERHAKLVAKQSTEERTMQQSNDPDEVDMASINLENKTKSDKSGIVQPEPVYAVVDLRNKYVQRKERLLAMQGKRWNSYESIFPTVLEQKEPQTDQRSESIYEDGEAYYSRHFEDETPLKLQTKTEEENIYEPINISEQSTAALSLRKYISRLTLNPFLRPHKSNKSDSKDSKATAHFDFTNSTKKSSKFSTMRSRFGVHRKSVQRRIRRFYGTNYEPNPLFQNQNPEGTPIVLPCEKAIGNVAPASKTSKMSKKLNSTNEDYSNCEPTEKLCGNQKEKLKTFDSLPHFKRAVARITLFNSSPFKGNKHNHSQELQNQSKIT